MLKGLMKDLVEWVLLCLKMVLSLCKGTGGARSSLCWTNKREGAQFLARKLDRILASPFWFYWFSSIWRVSSPRSV